MVTATDFLRDNNSVKWDALASSLVGGIFFAWWTGLISVVQAVQRAIETFFGGSGTIIGYELDQYTAQVGSLFNEVWTLETEFGLFELPLAVIILLVAATIVVLGVRILVR